MKLNYLETKDIGILPGIKRFDFHNQLTIIYGPNFSGKSTLAASLYFALCGKPPMEGVKPKDFLSQDIETAYVKLSFEENELNGSITRIIGKIPRNTKRVNETHASHLPDLEPDQWRLGYFLKEEEIADFISRTPSSRRDLMYRLLGIDRLMDVQKQIIRARRLTKREEKDYKQELALLNSESFSDQSKEIKTIENEIILLEEKIKSMSDRAPNQNLINELEIQKGQLDNTYNELKERVSQLYEGFSDIDDMVSHIDELQKKINRNEDTEKHLEHLAIERGKATAKLDQAQKNLSLLLNVSGDQKCPLCNQDIAEEMCLNLKSDYSSDIDTLGDRLREIKKDEKEARIECDGIKKNIEDAAKFNARMAQAKELERQIYTNREKIDLIKKKLIIHSQNQIPDENRDQEDFSDKLFQLKSKLSELVREQTLFQRHGDKKTKAEHNYSTAVLVRLKAELLADSLNKTMQSIIGASLETVEESISRCLNVFNIFQDRTGGFELEKSWLMPNIDNRPFQMLSGSEKTIVLIGLKVALSKLMPGGEFFVMDNPLLHLDSKRRSFMKEYVTKLSKYKQIIMFTNDREFADQFSECSRYDLI